MLPRPAHLRASQPLNLGHPLARGITSMRLVLPGFNEGGILWRDLVIGTAGTLTNMASPATATSGWQQGTTRPGGRGALSFDAVNDHVLTGLALSRYITASAATMALWMQPRPEAEVQGNVYALPGLIEDTVGYMAITIGTFGGLNRIWVYNYDGTDTQVGIPYTNNEWVHIALVHSGGFLLGYKNGQLVGSVASGNTTVLTPLVHIGANWQKVHFYDGLLDDVRTYNVGFSAGEVMALYENSMVGYPDFMQFRQPRRFAAALAATGQPVGAMMRMGVGR